MHQASVHHGKAWRQGLAFWLLFLSIFTHALVPAGSPLHRTSGSAFSATTTEVAIAPKRKPLSAKEVQSGAGDEGSSEGAGGTDDPLLTLFGGSAPTFRASDPAQTLWPTVSSRSLDGGAAPFSARAPPSI